MLSQGHTPQPRRHALVGIWKFGKNPACHSALLPLSQDQYDLPAALKKIRVFSTYHSRVLLPSRFPSKHITRSIYLQHFCKDQVLPAEPQQQQPAATPCHAWHIQHTAHSTPRAAPGSHSNKSSVRRGIACRPLPFVWFCFCWERCQHTK